MTPRDETRRDAGMEVIASAGLIPQPQHQCGEGTTFRQLRGRRYNSGRYDLRVTAHGHVFKQTIYSAHEADLQGVDGWRASRPRADAPHPKARDSTFCQWIVNTWKEIPDDIVRKSFKNCCISNHLDKTNKTTSTGTMTMLRSTAVTVTPAVSKHAE